MASDVVMPNLGFDTQRSPLTYVAHQPTQGQTPRNLAIDPTGTYMLVGDEDSDTVVTFLIDAQTGRLESTGNVASIPTPVCLKAIIH